MIRSLEQIAEDYKNGTVSEGTIPVRKNKSKKKVEYIIADEPTKGKKYSKGGEIQNPYELESVKEHMDKIPNPNFKEHGIGLHFNALLLAATGGGKTSVLLSIFEKFSVSDSKGSFNNVYIFTQNKEPIYDMLTEQMNPNIFQIVYGGYRGFVMFQKKNPQAFYGNTLIIFDDMSQEKDQTSIREHFILGRKRAITKGMGCSTIYLSQTFTDVPKAVRDQCSLIFIIKVNDQDSLKRMLRSYALNVTRDQLVNMYDYSCNAGHFANFFLIDLKQSDQLKKFRCNYNDYLNPDDFL